MTQRLRVAVLFGGRSAEHEISLVSARNIIRGLDPARYEVVPIGIDRSGRWLTAPRSEELLEDGPELPRLRSAAGEALLLQPGAANSQWLAKAESQSRLQGVDVVFPALHGPFGEDGSMQGLLRVLGVAWVGPGVLGSAVGMDKDVMKRLLRDAGIAVTPFQTILRHRRATVSPAALFAQLGPVLYVKPANLGSSVGISRVEQPADLPAALDQAFQFDTKVIVETGVKAREIEIAVLGNETPEASIPGEIIPRGAWYSYESKYIDADGAALAIPAKLSEAEQQKARELSLTTYQALSLEGMARVDLFYCNDGAWYVNEVNTIPGFTSISMYPKLWEASGLPLPQLLDRLIELAIARHRRDSALKTDV